MNSGEEGTSEHLRSRKVRHPVEALIYPSQLSDLIRESRGQYG